jgi:hypothetical protein
VQVLMSIANLIDGVVEVRPTEESYAIAITEDRVLRPLSLCKSHLHNESTSAVADKEYRAVFTLRLNY